MNEVVEDYRNRYRKCVYCAHLDTGLSKTQFSDVPWWCRAKLKNVTVEAAYDPRPFCSCFEVKPFKEGNA